MAQLQRLMRRLRPRSPALSPSEDDTRSIIVSVPYRRLNESNVPVLLAIRHHQHEELATLLSSGQVGVNVAPDGGDVTPVHAACEDGNLEALAMLVQHGADVNVTCCENGVTPLLIAATLGDLDLVRWLLDHGADVNKRGNQPVLEVVESEASTSLLKCDEAEMVDAYMMNSPLIQACREGHLPVVKEILKRDCDINLQNANGNTALHVSCLGRTYYPYSTAKSQFVPSAFFLQPNVAIIEELLLHGARTNICNHDGNTVVQRVFQVRCRPSLQMVGWRFTREENNDIVMKLFKAVRLLMQYGCNLPRSFWMHKKAYHDPFLSEEILIMVKFVENFGLLPEAYPVILDTLLLSLDNGCTYDPEDIKQLLEYDRGFSVIVNKVYPLVSCPRPLLAQCRTFLRSLLGSLHQGLHRDVINTLPVPSSLARYILGENAPDPGS